MLHTLRAHATVMACIMGLLSASAQAQTQRQPKMAAIDRTAQETLACLQTSKQVLRYPRHRGLLEPGLVRASLKFTAPDRPPEVELLFRAASDAIVREVRHHLNNYRLPCMAAGAAPLRVVQEFEFKPQASDPITWSTPRLAADRQATTDLSACLRNPNTALHLGSSNGPEIANVIVEASFAEGDAPPAVKLLYSSASKSQSDRVQAYVRQYRLPCLPKGSAPYVMQQHVKILLDEARARDFKGTVPLRSFLSSIKSILSEKARFDFDTMNCPFQVAWTLGKPAADNQVGEVGEPDLNRTEFLAWLGSLEMDMKPRQFEEFVGSTMTIDVPCGTLTLEPPAAAASAAG